MNGVQEIKLGDICDSSPGKRNNFSIMEKDGIQPVRDEVCIYFFFYKSKLKVILCTGKWRVLSQLGISFQNYAAGEHTAKSTFESTQSTYTGSSSTLSSDYGFSYASAVIKSDTGWTLIL